MAIQSNVNQFPLNTTKYQSVQQRVSSQKFTIRGDAMWILEGKGKQETSNDLNPIVSDILIFRILKNKKKEKKKKKRKERKKERFVLPPMFL